MSHKNEKTVISRKFIILLSVGFCLFNCVKSPDNQTETTKEAKPQITSIPTKSVSIKDDNLKDFEEVIYENYRNIFVKKNGKWGIINKDYQQLVDFKYDFITYAWDDSKGNNHNYIIVQNDKFGKITEKGQEIFPCSYDGITTWVEYGPNGHYVRQGDKMGLIDYQGEILVPIKYDKVIWLYATNWVMIYNNKKVGLYDLEKQSFFLPIEYDYLKVDYDFLSESFEREKPTQIITYKNKNLSILSETREMIADNVSTKEIKDKFKIDIDSYEYSPCSYILSLMIQNHTFSPPECLLKNGDKPEKFIYKMEKW